MRRGGWGASDGEQMKKKGQSVCFPDSKPDSARLIRKSSQEALVRSIPSSPCALFPSIYPFLGLSSPCCTLSLSFMISAARICTSSSQWKINSTQRTSSPQWSTSTVKRTHGHIDSGFLKDTHKQMSALKVSIHKEGYTHSFVHLSCCFPSV